MATTEATESTTTAATTTAVEAAEDSTSPSSALLYESFAKKACDFLTASPDPFHAVYNSIQFLHEVGFEPLRKRESFVGKLVPGGKYYVRINHSTLVAFTVGAKVKEDAKGDGVPIIKAIGGHTDSPNLKLKPISKLEQKGCIQLGVECYGGGLWHTWLDRDLGLSGRVLVRSKQAKEELSSTSPAIQQHLVNFQEPLARISTLCIHLQSQEERRALVLNTEDHLRPIIATTTTAASAANNNTSPQDIVKEGANSLLGGRHSPLVLQKIAQQLKVDVDQIADLELNLYDVQPATLGGIGSEFLYSARLDNLATCFVAIQALIAHATSDGDVGVGGLADDTDVSLVALFDHEEVGSDSAHGAGSPVMLEMIHRISSALQDVTGTTMAPPCLYSACIRSSFLLSSDMAHAVHPNYAHKHEAQHAPQLNGGVVIKTNSNQRYATNGITGFVVRELGRMADIPIQEFVVRNDCPCGSTIGPIVATNTGLRTVDIGMPQLSMHSCREVMGTADLTHGFNLFKAYFKHFREIDDQLEG